MRVSKFLGLIGVATLGLLLTSGLASAVPVLHATVGFSVVGGNLQVVLTNTGTGGVEVPSQVLTAVFFDITGNPTLTKLSAHLDGSTVVNGGPDGGGNVGQEWAYKSSLSAPAPASQGISSSGFGLFGPPNLFQAGDLNSNASGPDGLDYGITSSDYVSGTGNGGVQDTPLIKSHVTFTLGGLPSGFSPSNISNVHVWYGTAPDENQNPPCVSNCTPVPEPATLLLLGVGLVGAGLVAYRRGVTR